MAALTTADIPFSINNSTPNSKSSTATTYYIGMKEQDDGCRRHHPAPPLPPAGTGRQRDKNSLLRISHFYESLTTCTVSLLQTKAGTKRTEIGTENPLPRIFFRERTQKTAGNPPLEASSPPCNTKIIQIGAKCKSALRFIKNQDRSTGRSVSGKSPNKNSGSCSFA